MPRLHLRLPESHALGEGLLDTRFSLTPGLLSRGGVRAVSGPRPPTQACGQAPGLPAEVPVWGCGQARAPQPGDSAPRAHLREGGHSHAVGPLLEGAGCLGGEASGGCAVVGGREGQVILVQEVPGAAALALLQAAGTGMGAQGRVSPGSPQAPSPRQTQPLKKGVTRECSWWPRWQLLRPRGPLPWTGH